MDPAESKSQLLLQVQPTSHTPEGNIRTHSIWIPVGVSLGPAGRWSKGMSTPGHQGPLLAQGGWGAGPHQLHTITSCFWNGARSAPLPTSSATLDCVPLLRGGKKVLTMHPHSVLASAQLSPNISAAPLLRAPPTLISLIWGCGGAGKALGQRKDRVTSAPHERTEPHTAGAA